jgi:UrcA family protein
MKIIQNAATAAVLALYALSPLSAGAQRRMPVSVRVNVADLNLGRPAGRASLQRRLAAAARGACGVPGASTRDAGDARRCYREMMADGMQQVALRTGDRVELASVGRR